MYRQPGILFSYGITEKHLYWFFLKVIPLWRIRLTKIYHVRRGSMLEFFNLRPRRLFKPWRYWIWGTSFDSILRRRTTRFLIETRGRSKILLRLKPEFHYVLRTRISSVRTPVERKEVVGREPPVRSSAQIYQ